MTRILPPILLTCFVFFALPASAAEEEQTSLRLPTSIFLGSAAADWSTTYYTIQHGQVEQNPLFAGLTHRPKLLVTTAMATDVASAMAWDHFVGKKHPKLAAVGLYAMSGVRLWVAARNMRRYHEAVDARSRSLLP